MEVVARCGEMDFNLNGEEEDKIVENVPTLRYVGRPLDQKNDYCPDVCRNIVRARSVWGEARDTTLTGGGRSQGVGKFLQGGGAGNSIVRVGNVGPFGVNDKEDRGDAHRVPANDHREESGAMRRWDIGDAGGRMHTRGRRNLVG